MKKKFRKHLPLRENKQEKTRTDCKDVFFLVVEKDEGSSDYKIHGDSERGTFTC